MLGRIVFTSDQSQGVLFFLNSVLVLNGLDYHFFLGEKDFDGSIQQYLSSDEVSYLLVDDRIEKEEDLAYVKEAHSTSPSLRFIFLVQNKMEIAILRSINLPKESYPQFLSFLLSLAKLNLCPKKTDSGFKPIRNRSNLFRKSYNS